MNTIITQAKITATKDQLNTYGLTMFETGQSVFIYIMGRICSVEKENKHYPKDHSYYFIPVNFLEIDEQPAH